MTQMTKYKSPALILASNHPPPHPHLKTSLRKTSSLAIIGDFGTGRWMLLSKLCPKFPPFQSKSPSLYTSRYFFSTSVEISFPDIDVETPRRKPHKRREGIKCAGLLWAGGHGYLTAGPCGRNRHL